MYYKNPTNKTPLPPLPPLPSLPPSSTKFPASGMAAKLRGF